MHVQLLLVIALLTFLVAGLVRAQALVQTGRYTAVEAMPTEAQRDPLRSITTFEFPADIKTVGEAVQQVLAGAGYAMTDVLYWDFEVFALLEYPLPDAQRTLGPLTVLDTLKVLVGPSFVVVIDPVHRKVAFELDEDLRALGFGQIEHEAPE